MEFVQESQADPFQEWLEEHWRQTESVQRRQKGSRAEHEGQLEPLR